MAWVRSEYAGELAVVAAWVSALLPWSVSFVSPEGFSFVVVRFPYFMFQFLYGLELGDLERPFMWVVDAPGFPGDATTALGYAVWLVAAAVLALALLLSVAYYVREERVESAPVDPVRVMGGLLLLAGILLVASVVLVWLGSGLTVPIGAVLVPVLGGILLRVERTDGDEDGTG